MKNIFHIILCLLSASAWSQSITPQVINAAGGHHVAASGISVTDNVGEPFSQLLGPVGNLMITEGYLQPGIIIAPNFSLTILKSDLSCSDKKDGRIAVEITSSYQNYTATYSWTPNLPCQVTNCSVLDSLLPGTYSVSIHLTFTVSGGVVKQDSSFKTVTIADLNGPCNITIYHGITPNGDNVNDSWQIKNIDNPEYRNNKVSIFNRWGTEVYSVKGYDNTSKVWRPVNDKLPASTYFYIIDLGNGTKPLKGWVELITE